MRIAADSRSDQADDACAAGTADLRACPFVPCAWGDVFDRLTILRLKAERFTDPERLGHVRRELAAVQAVADRVEVHARLAALIERLTEANARLWRTEDAIREREEAQQFDAAFIVLARAVIHQNETRAALKRDISLLLGSRLIEQKHYRGAD